jgi:hypothetical protein
MIRKNYYLIRFISIFLILIIMSIYPGCWNNYDRVFFQNEIFRESNFIIADVILYDGSIIKFDKNGGIYVKNREGSENYCAVLGTDITGKHHEINLNKIYFAHVEKREYDGVSTTFYGLLMVPALFIATLITHFSLHPIHSCPFVYTNDGNEYHFEGQAFAGAITQGLERDDYIRLNFLKSINGKYELILKNDPADEEQYIKNIGLQFYDHSPKTNIICDYNGNLFEYENVIAPVSAKDEQQRDISGYINSKDDNYWESSFPGDISQIPNNYSNSLEFNFIKPKGRDSVHFAFRMGSSFLGSEMIRQYLNLLGKKADDFYTKIDNKDPETIKKFLYLTEGEQLYHMNIEVFNGKEYISKGKIKSNGSLFMEERIMNLDISDIPGDTLKILLKPAFGFWKIDYLNIINDNISEVKSTKIIPYSITDKNNYTIRQKNLKNLDSWESYFNLKKQNDFLKVVFLAPEKESGAMRAIFLKTTGFYRIFTPANAKDQSVLFESFFKIKGSAKKYAIEQYYKWKSDYLCSKP